MTTTPTPRKRDLATLLASTEPSVMFGEQTETYWFNRYMEDRLADLVARVEKRQARLTSDTEAPGVWASYRTWAMEKFEAVGR